MIEATYPHRWVSTGHPEDDEPWCKNCGIPIDLGWGKDCPKACRHENVYTERVDGTPRRHPLDNYHYRCEECGATGQPDGPDHNGSEAIDWGTS